MLRQGLLLLLLGWVASRPAPKVVPPEDARPIAVARLRVVSGPEPGLEGALQWEK